MLESIEENILAFGTMFYGLMKANLTYLGPMGRLWYGEHWKKSIIQHAQCQLWNMATEMSSVRDVFRRREFAIWYVLMGIWLGRCIVPSSTIICFSLWKSSRWITNGPFNMITIQSIGRLLWTNGWTEMELNDLNDLPFHRIWTRLNICGMRSNDESKKSNQKMKKNWNSR